VWRDDVMLSFGVVLTLEARLAVSCFGGDDNDDDDDLPSTPDINASFILLTSHFSLLPLSSDTPPVIPPIPSRQHRNPDSANTLIASYATT